MKPKQVRIAAALAFMILNHGSVHAAMSQCETKESRGLRYVSEAMAKAAAESDPWRGCTSGCQMSSELADSMTITKNKFEAESKAALYKARAIEANQCPQYAEAIMTGIDVPNGKTKKIILTRYQAAMQKARDEFIQQKQWQKDHPQCKYVIWYTGSENSIEDLSGHFDNKSGYCSAAGHGPTWHGTKDDISNWDPDKNELIGQVACADVLNSINAFHGSYADPKFCEEKN